MGDQLMSARRCSGARRAIGAAGASLAFASVQRAIGPVRASLALATLAAMLCASPAAAQPAQKCFVLDTELQEAYSGACRDGKAEGRGTAKGSASYAGEFRAGLKQGRGVKTWPWGDRYEGGFSEDAKHGMGSYTWGARSAFAGDRYVGEFRDDKRNGFGVYSWASGDVYAGLWKDDQVAGRATQRMLARYRATKESIAAMADAGVKVCRESTVGTGAEERTEGEVQEVNQTSLQVAVRITRSAETPLIVAGSEVALGQTVWDDPLNWIPCNSDAIEPAAAAGR
jgi:hypothetical protein